MNAVVINVVYYYVEIDEELEVVQVIWSYEHNRDAFTTYTEAIARAESVATALKYDLLPF